MRATYAVRVWRAHDNMPICVEKTARPVGVRFALLAAAADGRLELRSPRDPRARRFADRVTGEPGDDAPSATLARRAGASLRTRERCFLAETGVAIGEWRRRVRLFH